MSIKKIYQSENSNDYGPRSRVAAAATKRLHAHHLLQAGQTEGEVPDEAGYTHILRGPCGD